MHQIVIGQHARHHGLADRHGADADARIVAAFGDNIGVAAIAVDGLARREDRRGRLDREARNDRLPGRNAAENAAGVVGQKQRLAVIAHPHLVGIVLAAHRRGGKAVADLDALDRVDAHQRAGEIAVELGIDRRAETRRHAFGHHLDHRAAGRARLAHAVEIFLEEFRLLGVGAEERIVADLVPVPARAIDLVRAHLHQRAAHGEARHDLARDGAGSDPRRGLARGGAAAAAIIVDAVFDVVGVAGVAGPVLVLDLGIVLRALIDILDHQHDRRAGRDLLRRPRR